MSRLAPVLPDNAPFDPAERAWLNGWLAGYFDVEAEALVAPPANATITSPATTSPETPEELPWHDMSLPLDERLSRAEGRPLPQRLMAAMAQQDCGQCGYLCKTYAEAIAGGAEKSLTRCTPGGKETARALKELLETTESQPAAAIARGATPSSHGPEAESRGPPAKRMAHFARAVPLNRSGSSKDTRHVVLEIPESDLRYEVGDSFGVHASNCPETVAAVIERLGGSPNHDVDCPDGTRRTLREALTTVCDIGRPTDEAIEVLSSRAHDIGESQRLQALAEGYPGAEPADADLLDLLIAFPSTKPPIQELVAALGVLQPRLYSIASSPKCVRSAVHLTVAAVRWEKRGRLRKGVASIYLAERAAAGETVPAFVQPSPSFRLPANDAPLIMIGPGTGVAPFRAFLQERRATGARGRNWLFFGDQHRASDFLYEDEFAEYHRDGFLSRIDVGFSRDQPERIYVQQRMRERAADLWAWLQEGAHIYVCGAAAMGRDVDAALAAIIARQGGMGTGAAKSYLAQLGRERRYQRDVY